MTLLLALLLAQTPSPLPDASPTRRGAINTRAQAFRGVKNFVDGGVLVDGFSVVTATSAPMTLFVEKDGGSDSNDCTDAGAGACLTLAGAMAKVPKFVNHDVTVNVAAGAYAESFVVADYFVGNGATLSINGAMVTATPVTGTASGTFTSVALPSATSMRTVTDSAQAWTATDLRGKFVTFTSGALSGQSHPIYDNTATDITLPTTSASMSGATYIIQDVGSVFTGTTSNRISRLSCGLTCLSVSALGLRNSGSGSANSFQPLGGAITFTNSDLRASGLNSFAVSLSSGSGVFTRCYIESTAGSAAMTAVAAASASSSPPMLSATGSVIRAVSNSAVIINRGATDGSITSSLMYAGGTGSSVISAYGGASYLLNGNVYACASVSINGLASAPTGAVGPASMFLSGASFVTGCGSGLYVTDGASINLGTGATLGVASSTVGIRVARGGRVFLNAITPTFTGVTDEIQVDGTNYTHASLVAASPQVLYSVYGSWVAR